MNENFKCDRSVNVPWGEIGYITYKRTYARRFNENDVHSPTEEFHDSVDRVINACRTQLNCGFTKDEEIRLSNHILNLRGITAGRFLWQLGTKTVDKLGLLSLQNCAFTLINDPVTPFVWAMDSLMLGSGVGYNIQKKHVYSLPKIKTGVEIKRVDNASADFIVPDTREGWVKLLGKVLKAHYYSGKGFTYSVQLVRSKGAPIGSFGGIASGPEELCWGMSEIHKVLCSRAGDKLRPIDALDIMNIIGYIVVSGNVRRSAQIAIGDADDITFLKAKRWDLGTIPNWRAMSNNSIVTDNIETLPNEFWDTYTQGEPYGLINIKLARQIGRLGEKEYSDPSVDGFNPCAEQGLADRETCSLAEIYLPNIRSKEELLDVAKLLYRVNKHALNLPCHHKETQDIVRKNMRMGIGITGALQCSIEKLSWLDEVYVALRKYDVEYSKQHNFNTSVKLTTIKPSGTLSLLAGVTPGAHPSPAGPYYIRRIRIASNSPLLELCRVNGYNIEYEKKFDGTSDTNTMVVEFPCKVPEFTPIASEFSALDQLEFVKFLQKNWSDNSVSVTVYYTHEDLPLIKEWLKKNYKKNVKTVSFLLYTGHGFKQAPYETITQEEYNLMKARVKPIVNIAAIDENSVSGVDECASGACPIK